MTYSMVSAELGFVVRSWTWCWRLWRTCGSRVLRLLCACCASRGPSTSAMRGPQVQIGHNKPPTPVLPIPSSTTGFSCPCTWFSSICISARDQRHNGSQLSIDSHAESDPTGLLCITRHPQRHRTASRSPSASANSQPPPAKPAQLHPPSLPSSEARRRRRPAKPAQDITLLLAAHTSPVPSVSGTLSKSLATTIGAQPSRRGPSRAEATMRRAGPPLSWQLPSGLFYQPWS